MLRSLPILFSLVLLLAGCSTSQRENKTITKMRTQESEKSCLEEMGGLSFKPQFKYGKWKYEPVPLTNWLACLPENKSLGKAKWEAAMRIFGKYPVQNNSYYGYLQVPSTESKEWYLSDFPNSGGFNLSIIPIPDKWEGKSVEELVISKFGGKLKDSDRCVGGNVTIRDYSSPHYLRFQTPIIKLKYANGEAIRFEACKESRPFYAVLVDDEVTLLDYPRGYSERNQSGEELIQKILENIRVNEAAL